MSMISENKEAALEAKHCIHGGLALKTRLSRAWAEMAITARLNTGSASFNAVNMMCFFHCPAYCMLASGLAWGSRVRDLPAIGVEPRPLLGVQQTCINYTTDMLHVS